MQPSEVGVERRGRTAPTDISDPSYFHKVVDCQWACPSHTPVPEYIRLIAQGRYAAAYMLNWESNVFPAILGRVCDRPCEPACRRGRVEEKPVAICRLKRVAADYKGEIDAFMPEIPKEKNGKRIALIGAGPASLTVARDLMPLGYRVVLFEKDAKPGGLMRSNIPSFRLPESVLDEEVQRILGFGVEARFGHEIRSLGALLAEQFDAVFIGTGAPKGKDLDIPGRREGAANIHIGIDWLTSVAFEHVNRIGRRVVVIGGGNTAMDCCRTSLRLGGSEVKVTVRSPRRVMKASSWEIEDAEHEGIPILDNHAPKEFLVEKGRLVGVRFQKMTEVGIDTRGRPRLEPSGEEVVFECDDVLMAIGQENSFPWIERDIGLEFDTWGMPKVDKVTTMSTRPGVFFGGDAAWGPENIIKAVAHGHHAAISIDRYCRGESLSERPGPGVTLISQKMGIHEWSYKNAYAPLKRTAMPHADKARALRDLKVEVELGFDDRLAAKEAERCLNCDVQTVFSAPLCIECDACMDICPVDCINFTFNDDEPALRQQLRVPAQNTTQDVYASAPLKTGRIMAKDEDMCLHCGLCAERCPTGAWDMQKFMYVEAQASEACLTHHNAYLR
ncbi:MAG TPA: FAD-dependent oxidoreductase [Hyphomicrobiaceae bacterium]|jgi:NADPH-dependent glutamate synthase beta subunit-like oxidoreductase|nr:FAD-dependent oxidoreductase [Hyphomicrobiaceae bacterium]